MAYISLVLWPHVLAAVVLGVAFGYFLPDAVGALRAARSKESV